MDTDSYANRRRRLPPAILLGATFLLALLYIGPGKPVFEAVLGNWVVSYNDPPFADGVGAVGAMICERRGIETYVANPCDPRGSPFVYPPVWKLAALLPVTSAWSLPVILCWISLFFVALFFLPAAPDRPGVMTMTVAMLSPPVLMAIEYGNNEMVIFALAVVVASLLSGGRKSRSAAYALILLAGLLKYFPFAAMAAALRERRSITMIWAVVGALVLAGYIAIAGEQFTLSLRNIFTMSPVSYVFGVKSIWVAALQLGASAPVALAVRIAFSVLALSGGWRLSRNPTLRTAIEALPQAHRNFLLVGCLMTLCAWLLAQNVDYRQIYLLMVLPALLCMSPMLCGHPMRRLPWLVLALMVEWPLRHHLNAMFALGSAMRDSAQALGVVLREAGWLALAAALAALALCALGDLSSWWRANSAADLQPSS